MKKDLVKRTMSELVELFKVVRGSVATSSFADLVFEAIAHRVLGCGEGEKRFPFKKIYTDDTDKKEDVVGVCLYFVFILISEALDSCQFYRQG